jgi:hypothetical protein
MYLVREDVSARSFGVQGKEVRSPEGSPSSPSIFRNF